ncbi:MAG: hypothetical protein V3R87_03910 [Dehalococcoidia bacterium]
MEDDLGCRQRTLANVGGGIVGAILWAIGLGCYLAVAAWAHSNGGLQAFMLWLVLGALLVPVVVSMVFFPLVVLAVMLFEIGSGKKPRMTVSAADVIAAYSARRAVRLVRKARRADFSKAVEEAMARRRRKSSARH